MAAAIAEQREHGPDVRRDTLHENGQTTGIRTVHLAQQLVPDRAKIVLEGVAA